MIYYPESICVSEIRFDVRDGRVKAEEPATAAPAAKAESNGPKVIYVQDLLK